MGGTYYLMFTEEDNSYIIVEDAELVGEAEDVCQHSKISYLYRNRLWMGEVIEKSGKCQRLDRFVGSVAFMSDRETLETLMKQLGMKLKRAQAPSKTVSNVVPSDLLGKRKSNPVVKYGEPSTSTSHQLVKKAKRLSQEERHQLDETKRSAERAKKKTDVEILDCLVSPSRNEVMFGESDSDDSDLNDNINSNKKTVAAERQQLVKGIKQLQGQSAAPPGKPKGHSALPEKPEGPSAALVPEKPKGPSAAPVPETPKGPSAAAVPEKPKGPSAAALPEKPTSMNLVEELQKKIALLQAELKAKENNDNSDLNGNELDDLNQSHDASKDIQNNSGDPKEGSAVDKDDDTEYNLEDDDELLTHQLRGKGPVSRAVRLTG
ncbi:hypothetical protein ONE63_003490 [Megalurothrips usitatus]|uniref:Uncharacterized protein n=1 Tax=Megalurothrips usitatus TaxID=439358 RepID=A0AAV7X5P5_9NEOP|nr:hypothetical protein ONE63_003490 [Megalurothrips usitatus]